MRKDRFVQLLLSLLVAACSLVSGSVPHGEMQAVGATVRGPLCGRIVFHEDGIGIVSIRPNGTERVVLSRHLGEGDEQISPDGTKIVFTRFKGNTSLRRIFLLRVRSDRVQQLTRGDVYDYWPTWSPDSKRIAFVRSGVAGPTVHELDVRTGASEMLIEGTEPAYSPAGDELAFVRYDAAETAADLYLLNLSSREEAPLTNDVLSSDHDPVWASDGSKLLFERYPLSQHNEYDGPYADIWSVDRDGSGERNLTNYQDSYGGVNRASFSPDASRIAYNTTSDAGGQVWVATSDGSEPSRVTASPAWARSASWAPDSRRISYEDGAHSLKIFDLRTGSKRLVYRTSSGLSDPVWVRC